MVDRQSTNVSLTHHQSEFARAMVEAGQFRTVSEVVREGLRLLEEAEHRRLLEKWIYDRLTREEEQRLPQQLKDQTKAYFQRLIEEGMEDIKHGRVVDGPAAMARIRKRIGTRK